jgi:hypothetical protein
MIGKKRNGRIGIEAIVRSGQRNSISVPFGSILAHAVMLG